MYVWMRVCAYDVRMDGWMDGWMDDGWIRVCAYQYMRGLQPQINTHPAVLHEQWAGRVRVRQHFPWGMETIGRLLVVVR